MAESQSEGPTCPADPRASPYTAMDRLASLGEQQADGLQPQAKPEGASDDVSDQVEAMANILGDVIEFVSLKAVLMGKIAGEVEMVGAAKFMGKRAPWLLAVEYGAGTVSRMQAGERPIFALVDEAAETAGEQVFLDLWGPPAVEAYHTHVEPAIIDNYSTLQNNIYRLYGGGSPSSWGSR